MSREISKELQEWSDFIQALELERKKERKYYDTQDEKNAFDEGWHGGMAKLKALTMPSTGGEVSDTEKYKLVLPKKQVIILKLFYGVCPGGEIIVSFDKTGRCQEMTFINKCEIPPDWLNGPL